MNNKQALESYFEKNCPELRVLISPGYGDYARLQTSFALQVELRPQDDPEMSKCFFLDELYKMIGKLTVLAEKMRNEPVIKGGH